MTEIELEIIAHDFIKENEQPFDYELDQLPALDESPYSWADDLILSLTVHAPDQLWDIILTILHKDPPISVLAVLAAGPLEDYPATNNEGFIVNVENRAKEDPKFASLLAGVWQNRMTDETWARVQKVWDRSGWDGITKEQP